MTLPTGRTQALPPDRPLPLPAGYRLGEFELMEVIGDGGFGVVYRAHDHSLQRDVAIKEYLPVSLARREGDHSVHMRSERLAATFQTGLRSFINEARTLAQFSHPALVRVHRFWEQNQTAYMAMQLYEGRTLRQVLEHSPELVTEAWLLELLGPLLGALETLHQGHCFHRDIAPDNIFIQHDGQPVLLDFGAARKSIADMADDVSVMVKSGYSPLEQYADDDTLEQGPWTDVYALGAVMYRAIVAETPVSAVVRSVQDSHVPLLTRAPEGFSPAFLAAIDGTLAVHARDRTASAAALAQQLGMVKAGAVYLRPFHAPPAEDGASVAACAAAPTPQVAVSAPAAAVPGRTPALAPERAQRAEMPEDAASAIPQAVDPRASATERPAEARAASHAQTQRASTPSDRRAWRWALWGLGAVVLLSLGWLALSDDGPAAPVVAVVPVPPLPPPTMPGVSAPSAGDTGPSTSAAPTGASVGDAGAPLTGGARVIHEEPATTPAPSVSAPVAPAFPATAATPAPTASPASPPPVSSVAPPPAPAVPAAPGSAGATGPVGTAPASGAPNRAGLAVPAPAPAPAPASTPVPVAPSPPVSDPAAAAALAAAAAAQKEVDDWAQAQSLHTVAAYESFLRRHRTGNFVREARDAIAALRREQQAAAAAAAASAPAAPGGAAAPGAAVSVAPPASPAQGNGRLSFNIKPWGEVRINGTDRGVSPPLKQLSLPPGTYLVEIRNGALAPLRQRITLAPGGSQSLNHEFK